MLCEIIVISALILELTASAPNRILYRDADRRKEMAEYLVRAESEYGVPAGLMAVWFFGESSLRKNSVGKLGEIGISQIHPVNWHRCRKNGSSLNNMRGQIRCGAMIMSESIKRCGSLKRGLYEYASGSCAGNPAARRLTHRRLKLWKKLIAPRYHGNPCGG